MGTAVAAAIIGICWPGMAEDPVASFAAEAGSLGVRIAILAWQREWDLTDGRGFGPVSRATLLAYAGGRLITRTLPGDAVDGEAVAARLRADGWQVELRQRNRG